LRGEKKEASCGPSVRVFWEGKWGGGKMKGGFLAFIGERGEKKETFD